MMIVTHFELFEAIERNHIERVIKLVKNLNIDNLHQIVNESGQTPLMVAVLNNNIALTSILLDAGFDPSQKDKTDLSPFIAAAANGFDRVLSVLITAKPDPTQVNRFGGTALLPSSEKGYFKAVQIAIDYGVPINHQNRLGWSALLEAVILGDGGFLYQDIARELVSHGGNIHDVDFDNKSTLQYAQEMGQHDFKKILEGNYKDEYSEIRQNIRDENLTAALVKLYDKDENIQQYYYLGYCYERLNDLVAAQYYFEKGLEEDGQFAFYLANLLRGQNKVDEALNYFVIGAEKTEGYYFDYHRSNYLRELGRHEEAVKLMDALLETYPRRTDFMFHKSNSLRTLQRHQEAYNTMIKAAEIQPQNPLFMEQAEIIKTFL